MTSPYGFYAGILRFVAQKTITDQPDVKIMMGHLHGIAEAIEDQGKLLVERKNCESAARAFAGVAKFLQERILPEALAAGNEIAVEQLKWAIETSLALGAELVKRITLAEYSSYENFVFALPEPPKHKKLN